MITVYLDNYLVGSKIVVANNFSKRFKGLMGITKLEEGEGLLLEKCSSIHTFFMKIPIDAVYVNSDNIVLDYEIALQPWKTGKIVRKTSKVLELPEHTISNLNIIKGQTKLIVSNVEI